MTVLVAIAWFWLILSLGTLLFLSFLMGRAILVGGVPEFRKLSIGFPVLVLILLVSSLCWPWAWWMVQRLTRSNP